MNFYHQNKRFYSLHAKGFVEKHYDDNESGHSKTYGPIYLNKSLTPQNCLLLKEVQKVSKNQRYKYPGYTINSQVRVRKSDGDEFIPINNRNDLRNIK